MEDALLSARRRYVTEGNINEYLRVKRRAGQGPGFSIRSLTEELGEFTADNVYHVCAQESMAYEKADFFRSHLIGFNTQFRAEEPMVKITWIGYTNRNPEEALKHRILDSDKLHFILDNQGYLVTNTGKLLIAERCTPRRRLKDNIIYLEESRSDAVTDITQTLTQWYEHDEGMREFVERVFKQ